jgi:8-oxo-dGTP pyrophosphatase MutT (NUDIX family)
VRKSFLAQIYKLGYPLALILWFVTRPKSQGTSVVLTRDNMILLIRNTYGNPLWVFPGGGVKRKELPVSAAQREVQEEIGLSVNSLQPKGQFLHTEQFKKDTVWVFYGRLDQTELNLDRSEVKEARWFEKDKLPPDLSSAAAISLQLVAQNS